MIIHPYNKASASAKALAEEIARQGHRGLIMHRKPAGGRPMIVGWGTKDFDYEPPAGAYIVNHPQHTKVFANKLKFFETFKTIYTPWYTQDQDTATTSVVEDNRTIVVRHVLNGTGGEGIEIISGDDIRAGKIVPKAPLYVRYQKKTDEFRLHLMKGAEPEAPWRIGRIQKKVAFKGAEIDNWQVRNLANGFKFIVGNVELPEAVRAAAMSIVTHRACGLDFVALDIIYHKPTNSAWVLEGNTAPGLEGGSVDVYAQYFIDLEDKFRARQ